MFISVYAIAKNEERFAKRWYDCFKEADEVCVLDTGSTDKTIEILRLCGAKVESKSYVPWKTLEEHDQIVADGKMPWRFDDARNSAMALCSPKADLLFCCDMDDVIEPGWRAKLERIWVEGVKEGEKTGHAPNAVLYTYGVIHDLNGTERRQTFLRHAIHTPNAWRWQNRCHEILEPIDGEKNFIHYPDFYFESRPEKKDHSSYLPLLEADARDGSPTGRELHLLAREYMQHRMYDKAKEMFLRHLAHNGADWNCERAASMLFLADCCHITGNQTESELWRWKSFFENPNSRDASFTLGQLLIGKKEYQTAAKVLEKCVAVEKPDNDYPFFNLDSWTELPYLKLAEAQFYAGKWYKALDNARKAAEMNPKNEIAKITVAEIEEFIKNNKEKVRPPERRYRIEMPKVV